MSSEPAFRIYPNPASDFLYLSIEDGQNHCMEIYGISGQLVDKCEFTTSTHIEISHLLPGLYVAIVDKSHSEKFMKK